MGRTAPARCALRQGLYAALSICGLTSIYLSVYTYCMTTAGLIRGARRSAGITQLELAQRTGTAQSAVAAYESGARTPTFSTLQRLCDACEHDVKLSMHPRIRRGAASLAEIAKTIERDPQNDHERDAARLLFGFADDFRGSSRPGWVVLLAEEPPPTGDTRFDAALAGLAELFAAEAGIPAPTWVNGASRFVEPWWFVASRPAFHAYTLAHTPAVMARHGVFMAREVFDRA
jgi:transcriptional regulator with XRE-family HTH domain